MATITCPHCHVSMPFSSKLIYCPYCANDFRTPASASVGRLNPSAGGDEAARTQALEHLRRHDDRGADCEEHRSVPRSDSVADSAISNEFRENQRERRFNTSANQEDTPLAENIDDGGRTIPSRTTACPDCGGIVSLRASACPHCGCPRDTFYEDYVLSSLWDVKSQRDEPVLADNIGRKPLQSNPAKSAAQAPGAIVTIGCLLPLIVIVFVIMAIHSSITSSTPQSRPTYGGFSSSSAHGRPAFSSNYSEDRYRYDRPVIVEGEHGGVYVIPPGEYTRDQLERTTDRMLDLDSP